MRQIFKPILRFLVLVTDRTTGFTERGNKKKERGTEVGAGRDNSGLDRLEIEMQKCMTDRSKLGLRVKLGIRVTHASLRNQVSQDDSCL